jgi:hypothetical protein
MLGCTAHHVGVHAVAAHHVGVHAVAAHHVGVYAVAAHHGWIHLVGVEVLLLLGSLLLLLHRCLLLVHRLLLRHVLSRVHHLGHGRCCCQYQSQACCHNYPVHCDSLHSDYYACCRL